MSGLVHIYCGDGKGKTTAAMGLSLRAAGSGKRVLILQFLKDGTSSEFTSFSRVPGVTVVPQTRTFGFSWTLTPEQKAEAKIYYTALLEDAFRSCADYDLLVLDEALGACGRDFIEEPRLLELLASKPAELEIVLTGRNPSEKLQELADYITEMRKIKHPFERGIAAREGIEY